MVKETFDLVFIIENMPKLLGALPQTIIITDLSLIFGWLVGLLSAVGKVSGPKFIRLMLRVLTDIIRGIPTVVLLYIVYFGLPTLLKNTLGINISGWSKQTFVILALTIELGTSSSEMFRSAYSSISNGQLEAAHALGYTRFQRFVHVILPQGVFVILPNMGSAVLAIIQATALVYTLGIFDVLGKARQIDTNMTHIKTFEMYLAAALIYWVLALVVGWIFKLIEKVMGRGRKVVA